MAVYLFDLPVWGCHVNVPPPMLLPQPHTLGPRNFKVLQDLDLSVGEPGWVWHPFWRVPDTWKEATTGVM